VVFVPEGAGFEERVAALVPAAAGGPLLTERITAAFPSGIDALVADPSVDVLARGTATGEAAQPIVLTTDAAAVTARPETLLEECFGPVTVLVRYSSEEKLHAALRAVPGSLTATLHSELGDDVAATLALLQARAGRVLFAGWPTGVAVTWSQQHGGPWPATTSLHTSVGATAIRRFLRPVAYQSAPQGLLPEVLRDESLARLPHRRNGQLVVPR
jgi:NADP-dependent aldehyde dehydrogenase